MGLSFAVLFLVLSLLFCLWVWVGVGFEVVCVVGLGYAWVGDWWSCCVGVLFGFGGEIQWGRMDTLVLGMTRSG